MTDQLSDNRREIRGYHTVRAAAKDFETYSSDLIGDWDVRSYRQLPLEVDPPAHTQFREALQPLFMSAAIEPHGAQFEDLARRLIQGITTRGGGELATELALPYVIGCLTIIYNRPQDYDEWLSWGPDVWTAEAYAAGNVSADSHRAQRERDFHVASQRSGKTLEAYLRRVFDEADTVTKSDSSAMDVWDTVSGLRVGGKVLTREEKYGIGNVLLAGGRDTVIKLITGLTWHLISEPNDREFLAANTDAFNRTISEMVRFLSPLPKIGRVLAADRGGPNGALDPSKYLVLSFVSANHDRNEWVSPDRVDIHRERKPHLAFGLGRHSCMGMNITEHEARAFLRALINHWPGWRFDGTPDVEWVTEGEGDDRITIIDRFNSVHVTTTP